MRKPPQPDTPTVSVEVFVDISPDGPACFIQPPPTCTAYVNVSIAGGPAGVGTLRVSGPGTPSIQLGTANPGYSGGFEFKNVAVNPGGTITYTADYGAPGNAPLTHYNGSGSHKFEPFCLIFGATWHGTMNEDKSCTHDGPSGDTEEGYTYAASYSVNGQYAVNPEDGSGKSAQQTPVDVNEGTPHIHWTNDTIPDGTHNAVFPHRSFISLPRRQDRRAWLQARMADAGVAAEWVRAVDARTLRHPCGFKDTARRANSLSFRFLIRQAERRRSAAMLVLEDDAVFHPEFRERVAALSLPDDWQIFYFGCQHLETPRPVSPGLVRGTRALDTHAVAFRASAYREVRKIMRGHRCGRGAAEQFNDVLLSKLHKKLPTYAAFPNLIWQALGSSDLTGHTYSNYDAEGRQIHGAEIVRHLYP